MKDIEWSDFEKIELVVGTIVEVEDFPKAKKPAYLLKIDLGPKIGIKNQVRKSPNSILKMSY